MPITLLRNYYSSETEIRKGKLVAYRVIKDAIDIGAYGLGEPISTDFTLGLESKALLLKVEKKVWRAWLGIVSSLGFREEAIRRAEDHQGKELGLVLVDPKSRRFHCSKRGQCKKALRWLILW